MKSIKAEKIIELVRSNRDNEAFRILYKTVWPGVNRYVRKNHGDSHQAEDVFHDGVLKLVTMIHESKLNEEIELKGYLFTICKNFWIERSRRDQRITLRPDNLEHDQVEESSLGTLVNKEKEEAMDKMLDSIGDKCKELLKLTFYQNYSLEEAAEMLGISNAGVAKTNQYRCKKKLIEMIEKDESFKELMGLK